MSEHLNPWPTSVAHHAASPGLALGKDGSQLRDRSIGNAGATAKVREQNHAPASTDLSPTIRQHEQADQVLGSCPITEEPEPSSGQPEDETVHSGTVSPEIRLLADAIALVLVSSIGRLTQDEQTKPSTNRRKRRSLRRRSKPRPQYALDSRLPPRQAAKLLGVSEKTLANWRHLGTGPVYEKPGGRYVRYQYSDLIDFLNAGRRHSTSDVGGSNA